MWKILATLLFILNTSSASPPCADITHSECGDNVAHLFLETDVPNQEACHLICIATGERCNFLLFDHKPFARGNCRLYDEKFSRYILHCNELAGPKTNSDDCDLLNPPDNTCQIFRNGKCDFGEAEETHYFSSWENCQAACKSTSECKFWQFEKEEGLCQILYSSERTCTWDFSPQEPQFEDCDYCEVPESQKHGDWFCPPSQSANTAKCHLECHPGYVSTNRTIITCSEGVWSGTPTCVPAIGLITGSFSSPHNTVEIYGYGIHEKLPNLPDDRYGHSLQMTDSSVFLCGSGGEYTSRTSCLKMTPSQHWTSHSTITFPRYKHSSVSILGQLHLLGGDYSPSTTEYLSPSTSTAWTPGPDLQEDTTAACTVKINPEVYLVTGGEKHPASVVSYNVTSGVTIRLKDLNKPRYHHGCVTVRDPESDFKGVLVAGGYDGWVRLSDSEIFDLSTGQWSNTGRLTRGRRGVRMMVLQERILALGGSDGSALATVDQFNMATRKWSATEEMLEPRVWHGVTLVPSNLVGISYN